MFTGRRLTSLGLALFLASCGEDPSSTSASGGGSGGDASVATPTAQGTGGDGPGPGPAGGGGEAGDGGGGSSTDGAGGAGGGELPDDCPRVRVTVPEGTTLNVRGDPSTANAPVGVLQRGAIVDVVAEVSGEVLEGNALWFEITSPAVSGFVFSGLVECTLDFPPDPPDGFYLPLECGTTVTVSQGNQTDFSHNGDSAFAFDFSLGIGTPMVAMADGVVAFTFDETGPGDPCYDGGGPSCITEANYVVVRHADATQTQYAHLSQVSVVVGQVVARGELVGLSGSTGYSTGPHAHVQRDPDCGSAFCGSIPLEFVDAGVPVGGQMVTSMNCP